MLPQDFYLGSDKICMLWRKRGWGRQRRGGWKGGCTAEGHVEPKCEHDEQVCYAAPVGKDLQDGTGDMDIDSGKIAHCPAVTIPAVTPTFSSPSRPAASPEVPRDTSSSHVPLGSHMIHPRAPSSRPMPRDPVSRPRWVRLRESPLSTPDV